MKVHNTAIITYPSSQPKKLPVQSLFVLLFLLQCCALTCASSISPKQVPFPGTEYMQDLIDSWSSEYVLQVPTTQFNYSVMTTEDAVNSVVNGSSVIAAIDYPVDSAVLAQYPDLQMIPIVGGAVVPYFSLLTVGLTLNRDTLARIFLGNITKWNDPAIQATNPSVGLSSATINVVYRIDDAFSTLALSQALSSISSEWKDKYGASVTFPHELRKLPNFFGGAGEIGVFTLARLIGNGMTYISANGILKTLNLVQYARLLNQNGTRTDLRIQFTLPVLTASVNYFDSDFVANIADMNLPMAYPIIGYTYFLFMKTQTPTHLCDDLQYALNFITYAINYTIPVSTANIYGYAYLPNNVASLVREQIFSTTCNGQVLVNHTNIAPAPFDYYYYQEPLETFSGLTNVPYVPFYNYLGSTISASQADKLVLSTLSTLYGKPHTSSASSLSPPLLLIFSLFFVLLQFSFSSSSQSSSSQSSSSSSRRRSTLSSMNISCSMILIAICILSINVKSSEASQAITLGYAYPFTGPNAYIGTQMDAASRLAVINENAIDTNYVFSSVTYDSGTTLSSGDFAVINTITRFFAFTVVGGYASDVTESMTALCEAYLTPFVGAGARGNTLTTDSLSSATYQLFTRVVPPYRSDGIALASIIQFYGWSDTVALISSSDDYGVGTSRSFISHLASFGYSPLAEERYFIGSQDFSSQMDNIRRSLARVIVILTSSASDTAAILREADRYHLIGSQFVWLAGSPSSTSDVFVDSTGHVDTYVKGLANGMIGLRLKGGYGELYNEFLDQWELLSPTKFPGAGKRSIAREATYAYDAVSLVSYALKQNFTTLDGLLSNIRNANITGITGSLNLNGTQDRLGIFDIINLQDNYDGDYGWVIVGDYYEVEKYDPLTLGIHFQYNIQFHDGTIQIPDLIIHNKLTYWSCKDQKMKTDKTGKEIRLDPPGPDADYIDEKYKCDQFIDCYNMSDEWGCTPSYPAAYIALGIILGFSILFAVFCVFFTILFGYIIKRRRIRTASPLFLIIICISCIVGFGSDYAYFGQDSKVSCPFRMWLVTLAIITMISSLFIKSFRVWRLYRAKSKIVPMPDWQLLILVALMIIPVIVIDFLWTLIATPTASLIKIGGDKHYVCHAGGFTGDPIGYVFFAIVCAYIGLILLFGVFLSIVTRNIISTFNESRLIAVSTYNLFFLGVIGIPVYLVIYQSNPLASWVIYEVCVLYGFLSTLVMQFVPKMYGIVVVDKFKNTNLQLDDVSKNVTNTASAGEGGSSNNPNALF